MYLQLSFLSFLVLQISCVRITVYIYDTLSYIWRRITNIGNLEAESKINKPQKKKEDQLRRKPCNQVSYRERDDKTVHLTISHAIPDDTRRRLFCQYVRLLRFRNVSAATPLTFSQILPALEVGRLAHHIPVENRSAYPRL